MRIRVYFQYTYIDIWMALRRSYRCGRACSESMGSSRWSTKSLRVNRHTTGYDRACAENLRRTRYHDENKIIVVTNKNMFDYTYRFFRDDRETRRFKCIGDTQGARGWPDRNQENVASRELERETERHIHPHSPTRIPCIFFASSSKTLLSAQTKIRFVRALSRLWNLARYISSSRSRLVFGG